MKRKRKRTEWVCKFEDIPPDCYEDVLVWDCVGNRLTSLPPEIDRLINLQELNCANNQLTSLPPEIGRLTKLQELGCWRNLLDSKTMEAVKKLLVRNKE